MAALVIVGAGDHARVVIEGVRASGGVVAAIVQPLEGLDTDHEISGVRVVGSLDHADEWRSSTHAAEFIVAIGDNTTRRAAFERAVALGLAPARMIHPTATLLPGAEVGHGAQVCARAVIGLDARIGRNVIVNTMASLDHDAMICDHAFIAPGVHLAGRVTIGTGVFVGIGAAIGDGVTVGDGATVAAGAAVVRDVPPGLRVAGVPARPMDTAAADGG